MKVSSINVKPVSFSSNKEYVTKAEKKKKANAFIGSYAILSLPFIPETLDKIDIANLSKLSVKDKTKNIAKAVTPLVVYPLLILAGLKVVINTIQKFEAKKTKEKWAEFERSFNK